MLTEERKELLEKTLPQCETSFLSTDYQLFNDVEMPAKAKDPKFEETVDAEHRVFNNPNLDGIIEVADRLK